MFVLALTPILAETYIQLGHSAPRVVSLIRMMLEFMPSILLVNLSCRYFLGLSEPYVEVRTLSLILPAENPLLRFFFLRIPVRQEEVPVGEIVYLDWKKDRILDSSRSLHLKTERGDFYISNTQYGYQATRDIIELVEKERGSLFSKQFPFKIVVFQILFVVSLAIAIYLFKKFGAMN